MNGALVGHQCWRVIPRDQNMEGRKSIPFIEPLIPSVHNHSLMNSAASWQQDGPGGGGDPPAWFTETKGIGCCEDRQFINGKHTAVKLDRVQGCRKCERTEQKIIAYIIPSTEMHRIMVVPTGLLGARVSGRVLFTEYSVLRYIYIYIYNRIIYMYIYVCFHTYIWNTQLFRSIIWLWNIYP
jgi:hypothetical protein